MNAFLNLPWRHGPALAIVVFGLIVMIRSLRGMPNPTKPKIDLMAWLRGFRLAVTGFCLALGGLAWFYGLPWLLAIALGAGLQEVRESTSYILTLQRAARWRQPRPS